MTKEEIIQLSFTKLRIAIALKLGIAVYSRGQRLSVSEIVLCEAGAVVPAYWERITDISTIPDSSILTMTGGEYWLVSRPSSPNYLRRQLKESERESYIDALMDLCHVNVSLVYHDGVGWADYAGLWRLVNVSDEDQMRAWLIAKEATSEPKTA